MKFILHSDLNSFYASVECLYNPTIRNLPVVVVGDEEKRHGIVLSKNEMAKAFGIQTGDAVWEARQKAGMGLVCVGADFELYQKVSKQVKNLYRQYSDKVESFGIDEAWIDISKLVRNFDEAVSLAHDIRKEVLYKIGISVSIGVSYNKIFAKLGSDFKKPNAVTVVTPQNYQSLVWPLPVETLLFVGRATKEKLNKSGIMTVGQLAQSGLCYLKTVFGKNGETLFQFANGLGNDEVKSVMDPEKSIGNSTTCPRDLKTEIEVKTVFYVLVENAVKRMRRKGWWCQEIAVFMKDGTLAGVERQIKLSEPTTLISEIVFWCMTLFQQHYTWQTPVRALGVRLSKFCEKPVQLNLFRNDTQILKQAKLEETVEDIRNKFGGNSMVRGLVYADLDFCNLDILGGGHGIMCKN